MTTATVRRLAIGQRRIEPPRLEYGSRDWCLALARRDPRAARSWLQSKVVSQRLAEVAAFLRANGRPVKPTRRFTPPRLPPAGVANNYLRLSQRGDGTITIQGRAALFYDGTPATEYELLPGLTERISPTAFDNIHKDDPRALLNHDPNHLLGRQSAGTLRLSVDKWGLKYSCDLPKHRGDIAELIARGDLRGSSFAFTVDKDRIEHFRDHSIRWLERVSCFDVSPCCRPAYAATEQ